MSEQDYEQTYELLKAEEVSVDKSVEQNVSSGDFQKLRILCEMALVREYDDWYWGDPSANISKSIHEYCQNITLKTSRPLSNIRRIAAWLAYAYSKLDHDSDDAYLLLEHAVEDVNSDDGRIFPVSRRDELSRMLSYWRVDRGIPTNLHVLTRGELEIWQEINRWQIQPTRCGAFHEEI